MSLSWVKAFRRIFWKNYPIEDTAVNETNLNKIDAGLDEVDNRVLTLAITKLDIETANTMVQKIEFDDATGIFTVTRLNGSVYQFDTKLEKLAVNFSYDAENERLVITLDDGTIQYVDMSALITQYEFLDSEVIAFTVRSDGKVSATIKSGSITGDMLQPNYLADITIQADIATQKAAEAMGSAADAYTSAQNSYNSEISAAGSAEIATQKAAGASQSAQNAANSKETAQDAANRAANSADAADQSAQAAANSEAIAVQKAVDASQSAQNAANSEQVAVLKASEALTDANRAKTEADRAAQYSSIVAPDFYLDIDTMILYMKDGVGVDFLLADGNVLCWKVA